MISLHRHYITLLLIWLTIFIGCQRSSEHGDERTPFTIHGVLENVKARRIFLSAWSEGGFRIIDTASISPDGKFRFDGNVTAPEIFRISLAPENGFTVVVDSTSIDVQADAKDLSRSYRVQGSEESTLLKELMDEEYEYQRQVSDVEKRFARAQNAGESDSVLYYQEKYLTLLALYSGKKKDFIRRHPDSFAASYAAYAMIDDAEDEFLDSMLIVFNNKIPGSKYVQLLNEKRAGSASIAVGEMAPEIILPQPDGTPFSLSSLKGKYVLVDFWASWCRPCREENPNVVKLYGRYDGKGFDILGVSLDESKDQWTRAIEADGLPWHHVSDLKGLNSIAIQLYDIQAIPMTVLLDREGRIMALNLRGSALEDKLTGLFDE